ncbi:MAG: phosphoribosylformylglycinamidine synthase subunit PurL [Proteobacteria bacterium]|jgi:phosphoribosylformylglycinamidine synthase|nr:phosphoribosylformylglycinamidine synthase subunit PurL [Pseudomonadota bacterium]NBY89337.1 phosphoribosylformylglycinamidine synthase subunit PurL [Candidatus Fonsibacter lacus]NCU70742.1 phosphoribosylformylglycinamidine synthase subunit PurL [Candidatus Fonsibacter lacus]
MQEVNHELAIKHGLTTEEYNKIIKLMGRNPNLVELGIFSAMWNEHCSYKSSRIWLQTLPTKNKYVIQGPGENAGVVDFGDGDVVIFKIESHNHPSYIEPYQGAATGVGGILRDVFTMGARPVANLNSIRFGSPNHEKTKYLLNGVVSGIGGYGNCIGVPTVGGETEFDECYNGNILVNAMNIGVAKKNKVFYSIASGVGNPVVYVGSKTGRDGIHGATMASAEFDEDSESKKPTVQVGDPFTEKLLLEACLELMQKKSIVSIQDMGAAGLTSSSIEMASKGDLGIKINLNLIPCRENNMTPYEIMLSESQERMLMVLKKGKEKEARKIFEKWGLDFAIIGQLTNSKKLELEFNKKNVCSIPIHSLGDNAPKYKRDFITYNYPKIINYDSDIEKLDIKNSLIKILSHHNYSNKSWVWEQYDHMVMTDTIQKPGGDSAVIRYHGKNKGIAATVDCVPRYCKAHPKSGAMQAVCETWRNLISVGAQPIAITNCLNFGNPEKKEIMGQFVDSINGMREACETLNYPVISGNVSLYNETNGVAIYPTPTIGGVGLLKNINNMMTLNFKNTENIIAVVGETSGHLSQSALIYDVMGNKEGPPPQINLKEEKKNGLFVSDLIKNKLVAAVHDVSHGGIIVTVAEMCMASNIGAKIKVSGSNIDKIKYLFSEDQARYLIEISKKNLEKVKKIANTKKIKIDIIGNTQSEIFEVENDLKISVKELKTKNESWFKNYNKD